MGKDTATLVAAAIAAIVSLISLIVSERNRRAQTRMDHILRDIADSKRRTLESLQERLSEFYEPLTALLVANRKVFERVGPTSNARNSGDYDDDELATTWGRLVENVILPNNRRLCGIIETKSHLIAREDSDDLYQEFLAHAYSYATFRQEPSAAHKLFPFPRNLLNRAEKVRDALRVELDKLMVS